MDIPNLVFSPATDEIGMPYDTIQFQVFDGYLYSNTQQVVVSVEAPVNTDNERFFTDRIIIAPNPVQSSLNLYFEFLQPVQNAQLTILDVSGKVVHQEVLDIEANAFIREIPVDKLQKGVYFVQFVNGKSQIVKRFVKQ